MDKNLEEEIYDFLEGREGRERLKSKVAGGVLRLVLKAGEPEFTKEQKETILKKLAEKIAGGPVIEAEEPLEEKKGGRS